MRFWGIFSGIFASANNDIKLYNYSKNTDG